MCHAMAHRVARSRLRYVAFWLALLPVLGAAEPNDSPMLLRVAVMSDLNSSYGTVGHHVYVERAVATIVNLDPDLVIITGDLVAGQLRNPANDGVFDDMWAAFHREVSEPFERAGIPLAVTPGNHDASSLPTFAREREQFAREWQGKMSDLQFVERAGFPFRFAFQLKDVLFVALDITTTGVMDEAQFNWLESLLARSQGHYREIIAFSHVPVWPVAANRLNEATLDARLHSLLVAHDVGVYLSGHHHAFYPGVVDGVTYINQACLGSGPRQLIGSAVAREPRGFTLLEFDGSQLRIAAIAAPDFEETVPWETLPREIAAGGVTLRRADLVDVAVSPLSSESFVAGATQKVDGND